MFYVLDENNNKIEAFDKEGVVAAIEEAAKNGTLANLVADTGFIKKLKCCVTGGTNQVAFITSAKYNNLERVGLLKENTAYFIVDDPTLDNIDKDLGELVDKVNGILNGTRVVPKATNVTEQLNGKNLTDIFENDGTTVKNATTAKKATFVKGTTRDYGGVDASADIQTTGIYTVEYIYSVTSSNEVYGATDIIAITDLNLDTYGTARNGANPILFYDHNNGLVFNNKINNNSSVMMTNCYFCKVTKILEF